MDPPRSLSAPLSATGQHEGPGRPPGPPGHPPGGPPGHPPPGDPPDPRPQGPPGTPQDRAPGGPARTPGLGVVRRPRQGGPRPRVPGAGPGRARARGRARGGGSGRPPTGVPGTRSPDPGPGPGQGPGRGGSAAAPSGTPVPRPRRSPQKAFILLLEGEKGGFRGPKPGVPGAPPGTPRQAPRRGVPGPPDPGGRRGPKNAHFFGYLITLPVGTDFAPPDFGTKFGGSGSGPAGGVQTGVPPPDPRGAPPVRNRPPGMLTRAVADRRAQWPLGPRPSLRYGWGSSAIRYRSRQHIQRRGCGGERYYAAARNPAGVSRSGRRYVARTHEDERSGVACKMSAR